MGRLQAEEMRDRMSLDQALTWQLRSNHYPPVPLSMVPVCKKAIKKANAGNWDALINLPDGITYKGLFHAPVSEIIRAHHLDTFLEDYNG